MKFLDLFSRRENLTLAHARYAAKQQAMIGALELKLGKASRKIKALEDAFYELTGKPFSQSKFHVRYQYEKDAIYGNEVSNDNG